MRSRLALAPLLVTLFACSDRTIPTAPNGGDPRLVIADAARDYKRGFYWLPPMVRQPDVAGTFDATLSPTVEICELDEGACETVIATYNSTTGPGGEQVGVDAPGQKYHVNWHTDEFGLSYTSTYRVSVRAGINDALLGYMDVQPAANGSGLRNLDNNEFMGLVDGRTLPIKFRIETGVIGNVAIQPPEATVDEGTTQQLVAIVTDLHGDPIAAGVVWRSSNENAATIDQNGLVTGIAAGIATITATSDYMAASATLTVEAVVGNVTVQPSEPTIDQGTTQQLEAIVTDRHGNPMTADVVWSSSDENVATVDQNGLVTGIAAGIATITATADGVAGTTSLTVEAVVSKVTVQPSEATIDQDTRQQFVAIVTDLHGNPVTADVVWSSSDENVATVDQNGLVTGIAAGVATITATAEGVAGTASLTVKAVVGNVTVRPLEATVDEGETQQFIAIVTDRRGNPMTADLVWSSSDEDIATIDQTGLARARGDGNATITATAQGVTGTASLTVLGGFVVDAGGGHTCALDANGIAFCWGLGTSGQLGNGARLTSMTPVAVAGGLTFATVGTGTDRSCGITRAHQAYCWGSAVLGDGTLSTSATPVAVAGRNDFSRMSVGASHVCAITTDGGAYCWGLGTAGRLGNGSEAQQLAPAAVSGGHTFESIAAGLAHTCAITTGGVAYCWGTGARGRLGNGSGTNQFAPALVSGRITFASISAGSDHTCGLAVGGLAYCWGAGTSGRLGTGNQLDQSTPTPVEGDLRFAAISAGENHTCAITSDGVAYCWGSGIAGQLGNGSQEQSLGPTPVSAPVSGGRLTFASISAGASYTCGVTTSDELYCWGLGTVGQLGNGTRTSFFVPTRVAPLR